MKRTIFAFMAVLCGMALALEPVALRHIPFENDFGGAALVDDEGSVAGDIQLISGGMVGNCSEWTNPTDPSQGDNLQYLGAIGDEGTVAMYLKVPSAYNYMNFWDCGAVAWNWEAYCDSTGHVTSKTGGYPAAQFDMGATGDVPLNTWFHYAWSWNKATGEQKVYIDGSLVASVVNGNWVDPAARFNVGGGTGNWKYNGFMDEFYIFDKALSQDELTALTTNSMLGVLAADPAPYAGELVTTSSLDLAWTAPANVASPTYDVYLSTDPNLADSSRKIASNISATTYNYTLPTNGVKYYWKVDVIDGEDVYSGVEWSFDALLGETKPIAVAYVPFEDSKFDGVTYLDDQDGVAGSIDIVSEGGVANMGSYGDWNNPTTATDGDSLYAVHPGLSGTVAMWVKYDYAALGVYAVMWDSSVTGNDWKAWAYIDNNMNVRLNGAAWQANSGSASDFTQWNHVAWTWDSDGITADTALFINGVEVNRRSQNWDDHADVMRIGGGGAWYPKFAGGMDEAYVFDMALTSDEIAAMVNDGDKIARNPHPAASSASAPARGILTWDAPAGVAAPTYNVYFSTDSTLYNSLVGSTTDASFDASSLIEADTKYYWRVDVVDGVDTYEGYIWSFTSGYSDVDIDVNGIVDMTDYSVVADYWMDSTVTAEEIEMIIDDFESYAAKPADPNVADVWLPRESFASDQYGVKSIDVTPANDGQALMLTYDFTGVSGNSDWAIADYKLLFDAPINLSDYDYFQLKYNCHEGNSKEDHLSAKFLSGPSADFGDTIYPGLFQYDGFAGGVSTDAAPGWNTVTVDISGRTDLTAVVGIVLDVSTWPETEAPTYVGERGTGVVEFDDIRIFTEKQCSGEQIADFDGDCEVTVLDLEALAAEWLY